MKLYYYATCPFCLKVIHFAQYAGISLQLRNIHEDADAYAELIARGGRAQVPFLIDEENNTMLYESAAIIEYLKTKYGK